MFKLSALLTYAVIACSCASQSKGEFIPYYQVTTQKPYDDVLAELEIAIAENNFRVTGHSRVGKVIRERGTADFPDYDTLQFCNLTHAKTILQMSPATIRYMPCNVVLYQDHGSTIVNIHLIPTDTDDEALKEFSVKMNETLRKIVDFAVAE
ncbi:hypothetical protein JCM14076_27070 [Methylosoma difficile]